MISLLSFRKKIFSPKIVMMFPTGCSDSEVLPSGDPPAHARQRMDLSHLSARSWRVTSGWHPRALPWKHGRWPGVPWSSDTDCTELPTLFGTFQMLLIFFSCLDTKGWIKMQWDSACQIKNVPHPRVPSTSLLCVTQSEESLRILLFIQWYWVTKARETSSNSWLILQFKASVRLWGGLFFPLLITRQ